MASSLEFCPILTPAEQVVLPGMLEYDSSFVRRVAEHGLAPKDFEVSPQYFDELTAMVAGACAALEADRLAFGKTKERGAYFFRQQLEPVAVGLNVVRMTKGVFSPPSDRATIGLELPAAAQLTTDVYVTLERLTKVRAKIAQYPNANYSRYIRDLYLDED